MDKLQPIDRGEVKRRARAVSMRHFWRLFLAVFGLYFFNSLLSQVEGLCAQLLFTDSFLVTLFGVNISLPGELLSLAGQFISAPITLGVTRYILLIVRQQPARAYMVFEWAGDSAKLLQSVKYGLWLCAFSVVTFPIGRFSVYYLSDFASDYLKAFENGTLLLPSADQTTGIVLSLAGLALYLVLSIPFIALPYVMTDNPREKFFRLFRYSLSVMRRYFFEYILFALSFIGWALVTGIFFFVIAFFLVYFEVATAVFIDRARQNYNRNRFFEGVRQNMPTPPDGRKDAP